MVPKWKLKNQTGSSTSSTLPIDSQPIIIMMMIMGLGGQAFLLLMERPQSFVLPSGVYITPSSF
jgi:hypothetical protein